MQRLVRLQPVATCASTHPEVLQVGYPQKITRQIWGDRRFTDVEATKFDFFVLLGAKDATKGSWHRY